MEITIIRKAICWILLFICSTSFYSYSVPQDMSLEEAEKARKEMVEYSKQFVGVPYVYGGIDKNGVDCSGLIYIVAKESIGVQLPRTTSALYASVRVVADDKKEPGDILFFKTVGTKISHVGLYLGNNQFIHAASSGPNTGVIVSSLNEEYWKRTYIGAGKFLPSGKEIEQVANSVVGETIDTYSSEKNSFFSNVLLEGTLTGDWQFFTADDFLLNWRGVSLDVHGRYLGKNIQPGVGFSFSYDPAMEVFKMPLYVSLSLDNGIRVYAGPVFSIGAAVEPGTANQSEPKNVKPSIFPGIFGVSWQSPSLDVGSAKISFVQDIHYCVFNDSTGAALPFINSLAAGLVFSTGFRVTFPMSNFF
ncbi:MAG: NlpC/P60 family protein [Spirochaetaceae bacterium]|nr:NlpC/P60 family protein [Spirochaetaceae bacterium]